MQAALAPGTVLHNRYRIVGVAGQGSFGRTYLARDEKQREALCVVKEFIPAVQDPVRLREMWQSAKQAVSILSDLQHPQLPRFQTLVAQGTCFYWVREYIEGNSFSSLLDERLAAKQAFSEADVIRVLQQVLPVLGYLHSQGIMHQAISPECLILRQSDQLPVLINFGLVKQLVASLQLHPVELNATIEHWGYAPPEQLYGGRLLPSSDFYALAVTAIVLLTGQEAESLYEPQTQAIDWSQLAVSPALGQVLRQMLSPQPPQRFTSALQVMQALHTLTSVASPMPAKAASPPKPSPFQPEPLSLRSPPAVPSHQGTALPQSSKRPSPASVPPASSQPPLKPPSKRRFRLSLSADMLATAALGIGISMLVSVIAWRVVFYGRVDRSLDPSSATASSPVAVSPSSQPSPTLSSSATPSSNAPNAADPTALRDRRRNLGIDYPFFTGLVDEVFYEQHPDLKAPGTNGDQSRLQTEWNTIANTLMDKLETLTPQTRGKLGTYRRETYDQWLTQLGGNQQTLDSLADTRFYELFPDLKGKTLNPQTFGQIWYAIAEEQVSARANQPPAAPPSPTTSPELGERRL